MAESGKANEIATKTIAELRPWRFARWPPALNLTMEAPTSGRARRTRIGLIGARGAHQMQAEMLCVRCGTTATLRVSV